MTHDPYHNPSSTPQDTMTGAGADAAEDLQFERAESATPPSPAAVAGFQLAPPGAATACAVCRRPIAEYYFEAGGKVLCPNCQQMIAASMAGGSGFVRFLKATIFGIGAGLVGAAVWWAVAHFRHGTVSGLVAILLGFMVGGAVRAGSQRRGGIGYQLLALLITYLAVGAGLIAAELTNPEHKTGDESFTGLALVIISIIGVFIGPILAGISSPIVGIIMAIALWQAWKINKHRPVVFNGPYRVAPAGGMPPMDAQAYGQGYAGAPAPPYPGAYPAPSAPAYPPPAGPAYAPAPLPPPAPGAWPPPPPGGA